MKVIGPGGEIIIGTLETSPSVGIIDYSRRVTDDFGVTTVVERGFARRMSVRIALPTDNVDAVQQGLADLRAVPAQWVADESLAWLNFDGFFKDFTIDLAIPPVSFCSLTVEGLAESEVVTETGIDPSPEDSASTLLLLQPVTIAGAMLVSSNVAETDYPEWSALTSYPAGARVILASTHRIYESAASGNLNNNPTGSSGLWFDVGPTNRWAMFDQALGTKTSRADDITLTLSAGTVAAIGMLDVVGTTVRVQTTSYDQTKSVGAGALTFLDLPGVSDNVTLTISGSGTVSVGTLVAGALVKLGVTEGSPTADITDYSRKEIDDFGEVTVIPRAWAKRMSTAALIRTDALDLVANRIASVRAKPSLWIADDGTDSLTLYGFFKDFSIEVGDSVSKLSLTVEGLSEATPFGDSFEGLSIIEKTVYKRSPTLPAEPAGGSYDFSTRTATPPAGWSATLPAGTDPAWASTATAFKAGMGGSAPFGDWSDPVIAFANGVNGTDGLDGGDGTDGIDGADGKLVEFVWKRAATVPATPTGDGIPAGWSDDPPSGSDPLWMSKAKQELTGVLVAGESWSVPIRHDGPPGLDGEDGSNGLNNATIFAYRRSAIEPPTPTAAATYTFATGVLTGLNNGWSPTAPTSDGNPLYVIAATASSPGASDTIAGAEWSSPVILAQDGSGGTGSNGLSTASIFLYQRNDTVTAPAVPTDTLTYTFASGVLSGGSLAGWSRSVPAASGGKYVFITTATALSASATDTIGTSEWATVQILAQNGENGTNGLNGTNGINGSPGANGQTTYVHFAYADSADGVTNFTTGAADGRFYIGTYTDFTEADSTNPAVYTWSLFRGSNGANGTPGAPGADGSSTYVHIAYSTAADGSTGFSTTDGAGKTYIGTYTDGTLTDSTNPALYTWSLIKGATGDPGATGATGVSIVKRWQRSPSAPATPSPSTGTPAGWFDNPASASGSNILWATTGERPAGGTSYTWTAPVRDEAISATITGQFVNLAFTVSSVLSFALPAGASKVASGSASFPSPTGSGQVYVQIESREDGGGWTASNGASETYDVGEPVSPTHDITVTNSSGVPRSYEVRGTLVRTNSNSGAVTTATSKLRI